MMTGAGQGDRGTYLRNQVGHIDEKHIIRTHNPPVVITMEILNMIVLRCVPSAPSENEASRDGRGTHPNVVTNTLSEAKNDRV
jgi:hypothetical protein